MKISKHKLKDNKLPHNHQLQQLPTLDPSNLIYNIYPHGLILKPIPPLLDHYNCLYFHMYL